MAGQRYGSRDSRYKRVSDCRSDAARERLNEAVTELRCLVGSDLLLALKRLPDTDDIREASCVSGENVRTLLLWSAQHVRLAAEFEAAARCCRTIEQELRHQIEEILDGLPGQLETLGHSGHDGLPVKPHRKGLAGWLKLMSQHTRTAQEAQEKQTVVAVPEAGPGRLGSPSAQSLSLTGSPEADAAVLMLGPLELHVAGRHVVRWNNLKARAVFQYLLIHHGRPVRRDALMSLQWPDYTPTSARNNLNVALHSLRNTLGGPWNGLQPILYRDGCYALNPDLKWWIDREEFLSAFRLAQMVRLSGNPRQAICNYERVIQLYRGPLFEDDVSGDWYLSEQRHLSDLYLEALGSLGQIYFDLGELASAESFGRLALTSDPCCESVHRLLMRCYASEHRQELVTRQYRLCVDALREELGVSPGEETLRLFRDLTSVSR
jgi:SARP family transcriptional regulator, regulator of embCAB operon